MGTIYKVSCNCGYNKKLCLGGGLSSCNINSIYSTFSDEKIKRFKEDFENQKVKRFCSENIASFCENCKEVLETCKLDVELKNDERYSIVNTCSICGKEVVVLSKQYKCPVCGSAMNVTNEGLWD